MPRPRSLPGYGPVREGQVGRWSGANRTRFVGYRNSSGGISFQRAWPARTAAVPDPAFLSIEGLDQIEKYIRDFGHVQRNLQYGMNALAMYLARGHQGFAQAMSRGPMDSRRNMRILTGRHFIAGTSGPATPVPHYQSNLAWKIPVRRITSRYYQGWKVRRILPGVWQSYNDTREAYFIEYGIHPSPRRVRRPIRKLALVKTLRWADNSRVSHRIWETIYAPLRNRPYTERGQLLATTNVQSPRVMRNL